MFDKFIPADRPDLLATALAVVDLFNERKLPHDEATTVALATFAAIAGSYPCCQERCAGAAQGIANWLRIRAANHAAAESPDTGRVAEEAERSARGVPMQDQQRLTASVSETHSFLISRGMPLWQYLDTLVSLYVSAIEAHPAERENAHVFGQRLQQMFPLRAAAPMREDGTPVTH